ncbi:PREDICTED: putative leucine-rich repeat-containing protein DDB_G0290503 isoform X2 [Vollenhovia emeryi]|uniref:putative leucine-rich repeat-containing protein DDB_G0290503 isoform X2 n=1 Tax=Vollenhovia emeryi TaxID=411798 RepID=UPI0005F43EAC|nr:PREDICTED: putative leucine-rich repeat-containing protein DDB_G0290503 isoform X2 [Vollenhovia emeryi]
MQISEVLKEVHSMPPNIDWNTSRNDSDPVVQNEKVLKLFLQLAVHAANRLARLRKETDKGYDCNRRNDNPLISTTEALVTQSPSRANLEWFDNSTKILNHSSFDDLEINADQNQTALYPHLNESFNSSNLPNIDDQSVARTPNSKMNDLISKTVQDVLDTSPDITGHNRKAFNSDTLQKSILDLDAVNNSLNANAFKPDSWKSTENDVSEKLLNQSDLIKNITNTSVINDLTKTVNKFLPKSQNLQDSTIGISQRLFDTDLVQIVPKIISNVQENANQHTLLQNILQHTREQSDKIDDINQRFLDPIKNFKNVSSPQVADNLPVVKQILSNTRNIVESMIEVLPEAAKNASNLLNQIPRSQENITEEYTQLEQSKTAAHAGNQFDPSHNRQHLTSNAESHFREAADASGGNKSETTVNDLLINGDNSTAGSNNKQYLPALLKDPSVPLLRLLPDFNEHENDNSKIETDLSFIRANNNTNNFTDEKQLVKDYEKTDQDQIHLDKTDEEVEEKVEELKKMNKQLNPISEDLPQKSAESELTDVAAATSTSPDQLESNPFTLVTIMERQAKSSVAQDSKYVNDVTKSDLVEVRKLRNNPADPCVDDGRNRSIENQIIHVDNLLEFNSSFIDELKDGNLDPQLSEKKLQEISDQLIKALWPLIERRMDNSRSDATDQNKNSPSNISDVF